MDNSSKNVRNDDDVEAEQTVIPDLKNDFEDDKDEDLFVWL